MHFALQPMIVALLVPVCALYAAWKLMPAAARRPIALALLRVPHLPRSLDATLRRAAKASSGCGCDGCDQAEKKPAAAAGAPGPSGTAGIAQPITFHPRARR
jgi:hypothetical protein